MVLNPVVMVMVSSLDMKQCTRASLGPRRGCIPWTTARNLRATPNHTPVPVVFLAHLCQEIARIVLSNDTLRMRAGAAHSVRVDPSLASLERFGTVESR
jgi:hypothetical protein